MSSTDTSSDTKARQMLVKGHGLERDRVQSSSERARKKAQKKVVVVGLGMVGVAFM